MPSAAFGLADFKVFDVKGFQPRMGGIRRGSAQAGDARPQPRAGAARSLGGETFAQWRSTPGGR